MRPSYRCIFFDLDHTLWDYETNSAATLCEMFGHFRLAEISGMDFHHFHYRFRQVNRLLWFLYDRGKMESEDIRKLRFELVLRKFKIRNHQLASDMSHYYLAECPQKTALMPGALQTVQELSSRYRLSVITNGFDEVQMTKLSASGLLPFFEKVVTSQRAGFKKPAAGIFRYALHHHNIRASEAIMVGDNPVTDIGGAMQAKIDAVLFNPSQVVHGVIPTYEISHLPQLCDLL